jgi:hypothetical protein
MHDTEGGGTTALRGGDCMDFFESGFRAGFRTAGVVWQLVKDTGPANSRIAVKKFRIRFLNHILLSD